MDNIAWNPGLQPGYRLKKLELTNWGTFDSSAGQIYSLRPEGRTTLLVGQNGSGKSTLVDTLLTLLVQPGVRNYNVAAGAKKRERDERTYIRGACGRSSDEANGSQTDYLRPHDKHYSVLLACFERASTGDAFTLVQVLQILGDGEVDKTYAFADDERGIAADLAGLSRNQKIRKQLIERGFKATTKYSEYLPWLARKANLRPKAMDIFNQTVAVKDIQSLNRFIREHMLEAKPWRDRIEGLLDHFSQLSQAHQSVVRARRQIELLAPIARAAEKLGKLASEQALHQQQLDAMDSFFRHRVVDWLQPKLQGNADAMEQAQGRQRALEHEIDALDDSQRYLKNEIETAGGERLRQLPHQLETQRALLAGKQRERSRLTAALKTAGLEVALQGPQEFQQLAARLTERQTELSEQSTRLAKSRLELAQELTAVRGEIEREAAQLKFLEQQPGNLPGPLAEIRRAMARQLGLLESDLPFACELISVADSEYHWQAAIECIVREFALTMLVSSKHFRAVAEFLNSQPLQDTRGAGQRLIVECIGNSEAAEPGGRLHEQSLVHKLQVRGDHPCADWIVRQLRERFDYRCCSTPDQFQRVPGPALLESRQWKHGPLHREKDDRQQAQHSKHFVLGWDNAQRLGEIRATLAQLQQREAGVLDRIHDVESQSKQLSRRLAAVDVARGFDDFELIDTSVPLEAIGKLEAERAAIEQSNDAVRVLRERLEETQQRRAELQRQRDAQVAAEGQMQVQKEQAETVLRRHQAVLAARRRDGTLAEHEVMFDHLHTTLDTRLAAATELTEFSELQTEASQQLQQSLTTLRTRTDPLRTEIVRCMQRFLSDSPEQRDDLRADVLYLEGFLGLLEQLQHDDLPRYEQRFQERLNEKIIQELGVFHAALQCERQAILSKIEVLNASLEQLEYQSGTYMRLEPRASQDVEIRDFQELLRTCLDNQFDGQTDLNEQRFQRIEVLIQRLREEERWRDKVTDVRRWFDFAARELEVIGGAERSCYEDSAGQSGGEKAKLAFTILVAAIAYQFDLDPTQEDDDRFHFVVVDEMFSKVDDRYADYALQLFEKFGLQLLIVAPLDAKARVTEPYVGCYLHTVKHETSRTSQVITMTADEYAEAMESPPLSKPRDASARLATSKPK